MSLIREILDANELRLNIKFAQVRFAGKSALGAGCKRLVVYMMTPLRRLHPLLGRAKVNAEDATRECSGNAPILFLSSTENQTKALSDLRAQYSNARFFTQNHSSPGAEPFPIGSAWLVSLVCLPASFLACVSYIYNGGTVGGAWGRVKCVAYSLDELLLSPGYILVLKVLLRRFRPKIVVMANDHNSLNRSTCIAAKHEGVVSVYVQHAPVSDLFPSVLFDHMLVDGRHAAEIYQPKCNGNTSIIAIGASRYTANTRGWRGARASQRGAVSLSFNKLDCARAVACYLSLLQTQGWRVLLRPHPGISQAELRGLPPELIDRRAVDAHLKDVDAVIAGNSGILQDAYMAGACPVYARDLSTQDDYYGYVKHGAVLTCTIADVVKVLESIGDETQVLLAAGMRHFNEAVAQGEGAALKAQKNYIDRILDLHV